MYNFTPFLPIDQSSASDLSFFVTRQELQMVNTKQGFTILKARSVYWNELKNDRWKF